MPETDWVKIKWFDYPNVKKAILQIPVSFTGIEQTQFLQLDTGTPESILFGYQLHQLLKDDPRLNNDSISFNGKIGNHTFSNFKFKHRKDLGKGRADQGQEKIGLLGADFLKGKILIIDFKNNRFIISVDPNVIQETGYDFEFIQTHKNPANVIVLGITLNEHHIPNVLYDTGSSRFTLSLNYKEDWEKFAGHFEKEDLKKSRIGNMIGNYYSYEAKISGELKIGNLIVEDPAVSYKDTDLYETSPLSGTLGNETFFKFCIVMDFINFRFGYSTNLK